MIVDRCGPYKGRITRRQVSGNRSDLETGFLLQVDVDVFQLRDVVLPERSKET